MAISYKNAAGPDRLCAALIDLAALEFFPRKTVDERLLFDDEKRIFQQVSLNAFKICSVPFFAHVRPLMVLDEQVTAEPPPMTSGSRRGNGLPHAGRDASALDDGLVTLCPFVASRVVWQAHTGAFALTVIVKATFVLRPGTASLAPKQDPIFERDHFTTTIHGEVCVFPMM
ncbi:MAG: hypothetical protein IPM54_06350 [Polyangiaceae bacterium]|nr:hypothetical protein [Polyangiaceae bacterium]